MDIIDINGNLRECASISPDPSYPGFMKIEYKSRVRKGYTHFEWYQTTDFVRNNPKLSGLAKGDKGMAKEDLGAVTKASIDMLEDATKDWPRNIYEGMHLWISRGKGEGQQRQILGNDKNKLLIDKPWDTLPDKTSQYVISFNVARDAKPSGNTLPGIETRQVIERLVKSAKKSLIN